MSQVLVVEDESAIAELIAINLRHAGYEVVVAANADEAIQQVDRVLPDWLCWTGCCLASQACRSPNSGDHSHAPASCRSSC